MFGIVWYIPLILLMAFFYIPAFLKVAMGVTYQSQSLSADNSVFAITKSVIHAIKINLWHGWRIKTTLYNMRIGSVYFVLAATYAVLAAVGLFVLGKNRTDNKDTRFYVEFALIGIFIIGLGFSPFAITRFRYDEWRVYFLSSFGAAIFLGCILLLMVKTLFKNRLALIAPLFGFIYIFVGMHSLLLQHEVFIEASRIQERMIVDVTRQAPRLKEHAYLIILNMPERNEYLANMYFRYQFMPYALAYVYQDYEHIQGIDYCAINEEGKMVSVIRDYRLQKPICGEGKLQVPWEAVLIFDYSAQNGFILVEDVAVDLLSAQDTKTQYQPFQLIDVEAEMPQRAKAITKVRNQF